RRFQQIIVNPPSKDETVEILRGLRDRYEAHHRVQIKDDALSAAVELSDRYISGRCLPDKAIDVIDESGARVRLKAMTRPPDLKEIDAQIEQFNQEKEAAVAEQDFEKAAQLRDHADKLKKKKEQITKEWREKSKEIAGIGDEEDIAEVVRKMPGGPVTRPARSEAGRVVELARRPHRPVGSPRRSPAGPTASCCWMRSKRPIPMSGMRCCRSWRTAGSPTTSAAPSTSRTASSS